MTEDEAIQCCDRYKLRPPLDGRRCWTCKSAMRLVAWTGRPKMLVCTGKGCSVRFTGETAHSPVYNTNLHWKQFLLLAWCFCNQHRVDQSVGMLRGKAGEEAISRMFSILREITAWYVCVASRSIVFDRGEVDVDSKKPYML